MFLSEGLAHEPFQWISTTHVFSYFTHWNKLNIHILLCRPQCVYLPNIHSMPFPSYSSKVILYRIDPPQAPECISTGSSQLRKFHTSCQNDWVERDEEKTAKMFVQMVVGSYVLPIPGINIEAHVPNSCWQPPCDHEEVSLGINPTYSEGKAKRIAEKQIRTLVYAQRLLHPWNLIC